jgi:hypothetical protein
LPKLSTYFTRVPWEIIYFVICLCSFLIDTIKMSIEIKKGEDGLVSKEEVECKVKA